VASGEKIESWKEIQKLLRHVEWIVYKAILYNKIISERVTTSSLI
jgi:nicotinic acid mononucleotide adenylyltransferase